MSFVTSTAQRRGRTSVVQGTSITHVAQTPYPKQDTIRQPAGQFRAGIKRSRTASIGDDTATGLVVHGAQDFDHMEGTDPDGAVPPILGDSLRNPDFPISFAGRGTMKFVSPIRITTIDGPLNVNGEVYSTSGLLTSGATEVALWTPTVGETDVGDEFTVDGANTWATYSLSGDHCTIHLHYSWSSKGSVANGSNIYIKGLPFLTEAQVHKVPVHCTGIVALQLGSYFIIDAQASTDELQLLSCDSTGVEVPITGAECNASGTISIVLSYHCVP